MFKKISMLFIAVIAAFSIAGTAKAAPVYYTFDGTIYISNDDAGALAAAGLGNGSAVSYTFLVDRAAAGTLTRYNGSTYTYSDSGNIHRYYTKLISAAPIVAQNGGYAPFMTPTSIKQRNYGYGYIGGTAINYNLMYGGSQNNSSFVSNDFQSPYQSMASWTVGATGFYGFTQAFHSSGASSYIRSNLTLTGISSTNPYAAVPEPGTLLLLGSGIFGVGGLGFIRRKFAA